MPAPRLVSLKGSDFTGLGIECYGGLKDGIYVKKVAPQGPASGHINIGEDSCSIHHYLRIGELINLRLRIIVNVMAMIGLICSMLECLIVPSGIITNDFG